MVEVVEETLDLILALVEDLYQGLVFLVIAEV